MKTETIVSLASRRLARGAVPSENKGHYICISCKKTENHRRTVKSDENNSENLSKGPLEERTSKYVVFYGYLVVD
jgi:hypothetical protein